MSAEDRAARFVASLMLAIYGGATARRAGRGLVVTEIDAAIRQRLFVTCTANVAGTPG